MWWDVSRIQATVTRQFVYSHLPPEYADQLDRPVGFGGGLTDGTYWDWIDEKAKRIFLVLLDLGIPEHVFTIIDGSWDDSDLPIALDQVKRLGLTGPARDERKFYNRQFHYLLRPLRKGHHTVYSESEIVPLDVVDRRTGLAQGSHSGSGGGSAGSGQSVDKVTLPGFPNHVFCRRRIPIGSGPGCLAHEDFQDEANRVRGLYNEHLVSYFASYVHQGYGYALFTPATDASLKMMLAATPSSLKTLDKEARRELVMNWIHCLVDTLCYVHSRGMSHGNIRPSKVFLNSDNHISFSDFTRLDAAELLAGAPGRARGSFDKEAYDYAAPEQWFRPSSSLGAKGAAVRRGTLTSTAGFGCGVADAAEPEAFSISRSGTQGHQGTPSPADMMQAPTPHLDPQAADVFSLGCVILELLGFLMKRPARAFAAHRAAKHKLAGRGGAVLDSSFHRNLGQVESWMTALGKEARKKDGRVFRGVTPMLRVVEHMLALHSSERPSVHDVQARMYWILTEACGIGEPHCVHAPYRAYGIGGGLKMAPMRAGPPGSKAGGNGMMDNDDDDDDVISIAISRRFSGSGVRPSSRSMSVGASSPSSPGGRQAAVAVTSPAWYSPRLEPWQERPLPPPPPPPPQPSEPANGLQAIRNLHIRDRPKPRSAWDAPPSFAANVSV